MMPSKKPAFSKDARHGGIISHGLKACIRRALPTMLLFACLFATLWPAMVSNAAPLRSPDTRAKQYRLAKAYYHNLLAHKTWAASRHNWLHAVELFRRLQQPDSADQEFTPLSLFMTGRIYENMAKPVNNLLDASEALVSYEDLVARFPGHRLADDALFNMAGIYQEFHQDPHLAASILAKLIAVYPQGDMASTAQRQLFAMKKPAIAPGHDASLPAASGPLSTEQCVPAEVKPIRYWSNNNYTRVIIETSTPVTFRKYELGKSGNLPRRLYLDLVNCRIAPSAPPSLPIEDGLLRQVRNAQFAPDTVRVVLDTQSDISDYKIFSLADPFRIVVDVMGSEPRPPKATPLPTGTPSLAQQLGLGIKRIVIDPGHGGKDPGAVGPGGLLEKDVVLTVAKKLATKLRTAMNCEVILTRDRDQFLPLEERTAIANSREGDLFVSIHVNAAPTADVKGVETYYLDFATSKDAMRVAALENASSTAQLSDLQSILADLIRNTKIDESAKLAGIVQQSLVQGLAKHYRDTDNLGVKQAPFIVLIGAQMPAILTEIAFVTNPREAQRLRSDEFLGLVAEQLARGITSYAGTLNLAAATSF